jgi:hypothetical protein
LKKILILFTFLLCFTGKAHAQTNIQSGPTNPSFCNPGAFFYNTTLAQYQQCGPVNTWTQAGGGVTSVTSLPATCSVGTVVFLTVAAAHQPVGQYNCITTNVFSFVGTNTGGTLNASDFGVTAAGSEVCDATSVNTSQHLTTTANDPAFTAAMVGWSIWGSNTCIDGLSYTNQVPIGTITAFNSAHDVSTSVSGASITSNAGALHLKWGPVEDTQLTNAENAAWNAFSNHGNGGPCYNLIISGGITVVKKGHFNTINCNGASTGSASTGAAVVGFGRGASRIMITPDFDFTSGSGSCPLSNANPTCFGGQNGLSFQNIGFVGGQEPGTNPSVFTCFIQVNPDSQIINAFVLGYGPTLANLNAVCQLNGTGANGALWLTEDGFGGTGAFLAGNFLCDICFFGSNNVSNITTQTNATLITNQVFYGGTGAGNGLVQLGAGSKWWSQNDIVQAIGSSTLGFNCQSSICYISGLNQPTTGPSGYTPFYVPVGGTTGHFFVSNSGVASGATGFLFFSGAGTAATFDDMGGNTFVDTAGQVVSLGGTSTWRTIVNTSTFSNAPGPGLISCAVANVTNAVACRNWLNGASAIAAAGTSVTVSTSAVTANSVIMLTFDSSLGTKLAGITCSTQSLLTTGPPRVTTRTPGTSFVVAVQAADAANPVCFSWEVIG